MNPNDTSEFRLFIISELSQKLHFLQLAARNKDFTELEYITDHLARFFSRFEFNRSYANTKQLELSISVKKPEILEDANMFIAKVGEELGLPYDSFHWQEAKGGL